MDSTDTSNLWPGTDLTCGPGARNLPAVPLCNFWTQLRSAAERSRCPGKQPRGRYQQGAATPGGSRCSGGVWLPQMPSKAGAAGRPSRLCPGPAAGAGSASPRDAPGLRGGNASVSRAGGGPAALSFLSPVRNRNAKEGYKGKMMSRKLLEGRRENQQACFWKRSLPEFSKQLLPTASSLRSGYHAAAPAFWGLPAYSLCWAALPTCLRSAFSDELFSNYALCGSDTSGARRALADGR